MNNSKKESVLRAAERRKERGERQSKAVCIYPTRYETALRDHECLTRRETVGLTVGRNSGVDGETGESNYPMEPHLPRSRYVHSTHTHVLFNFNNIELSMLSCIGASPHRNESVVGRILKE